MVEKDCQQMRTAQGGSDGPRSVCLSWHFALATVPKVTRWTEAQRARILAARFDYGPLAATRQSQPTPAPNKAVRDGRTKRRGRGCCTLCARVGVVQAQTPRAPPADSHAHPSATGRQRSLQRDGTKVSAQRSAAERSGAQRIPRAGRPRLGRSHSTRDSPKDMMLPSIFTERPAAVPGDRRNRCLRAEESRL